MTQTEKYDDAIVDLDIIDRAIFKVNWTSVGNMCIQLIDDGWKVVGVEHDDVDTNKMKITTERQFQFD